MKGGGGFTDQSPSATCRSVWQTPQAVSFTNTSPGPGTGILDRQFPAKFMDHRGLHHHRRHRSNPFPDYA
jgi:hypothetical protein